TGRRSVGVLSRAVEAAQHTVIRLPLVTAVRDVGPRRVDVIAGSPCVSHVPAPLPWSASAVLTDRQAHRSARRQDAVSVASVRGSRIHAGGAPVDLDEIHAPAREGSHVLSFAAPAGA